MTIKGLLTRMKMRRSADLLSNNESFLDDVNSLETKLFCI